MHPHCTTRDHSPDEAEDLGTPADQRRVLALFRKRLAAGNYDAILGFGQRRTLRAAAADTGLEAEVGVLRIILIRLLNEEPDLSRLAVNAARLLGVAVQAARLRSAPEGDLEDVRNLLARELDAFEKELEQDHEQKQEAERNLPPQPRKEPAHGTR